MQLTDSPLDCTSHHALGRSTRSTDGSLALYWSSSGVEAVFDGSELWAVFEVSYGEYEPWICAEINGVVIVRTALEQGRNLICLFRGMDGGTPKHIRLLKETQFMHEDSTQTCRIIGFRHSAGHFSQPPAHRRNIEFIGDSITSGQGAVGPPSVNDYASWIFSAYNSYPRLVADALDADWRTVSQSGWGIVCDCENNPNCTIPRIYPYVCALATNSRDIAEGSAATYDFASWNADAVVVNLGTNDATAFHAPAWHDSQSSATFALRLDTNSRPSPEDLDLIELNAQALLRVIRANNPKAAILWCYGMLGDALAPTLRKAVANYQAESHDSNVGYLALRQCRAEELGPCEHPGVLGHAQAAKAIERALSSIFAPSIQSDETYETAVRHSTSQGGDL